MNAMHAIYLRSILLLFGFAAFLLIEAIVAPAHGASRATPSATVGHGHAPA